jgi:hypothetical protein
MCNMSADVVEMMRQLADLIKDQQGVLQHTIIKQTRLYEQVDALDKVVGSQQDLIQFLLRDSQQSVIANLHRESMAHQKAIEELRQAIFNVSAISQISSGRDR